jgi:hypothetical protein
MVDRIDLLIAVIAIVLSVVGSSTAQWISLSKKADKEDLWRFEAKLDAGLARVESRLDTVEWRLETKLDTLILRFVPEQLPRQEN